MSSIIQYIDFYYDSYEKEFGDGFYPILQQSNGPVSSMIAVQIQFTLSSANYWIQTSQDMIYGLDGEHGKLAFDLLTLKSGKPAFGIMNTMNIQIYPKKR